MISRIQMDSVDRTLRFDSGANPRIKSNLNVYDYFRVQIRSGRFRSSEPLGSIGGALFRIYSKQTTRPCKPWKIRKIRRSSSEFGININLT